MINPYHFFWKDQHLWLHGERAIFWEDQKALIISDSHFGKSGHFRKEGIAVPQAVFMDDIRRLFNLVQFYKAEQLIVVGDLFHSRNNREHDLFLKWRNDLSALNILLVKGNHDILKKEWYQHSGIQVFDEVLTMGNFAFAHDINDVDANAITQHYFFSGHIHPGIAIKSSSRQALKFPCFYFGIEYAILPAFGHFTGLAIIKAKKSSNVFGIVNKEIIRILQ